jgi:hypothetical protein
VWAHTTITARPIVIDKRSTERLKHIGSFYFFLAEIFFLYRREKEKKKKIKRKRRAIHILETHKGETREGGGHALHLRPSPSIQSNSLK